MRDDCSRNSDRIFAQHFEQMQDREIIIATGLQQVPYDNIKFYYRLKILDAVFEKNKELDLSEYLNKIDNFSKENFDQISSNLKELYNRISLENKT